jgi:hypothetical protein
MQKDDDLLDSLYYDGQHIPGLPKSKLLALIGDLLSNGHSYKLTRLYLCEECDIDFKSRIVNGSVKPPRFCSTRCRMRAHRSAA